MTEKSITGINIIILISSENQANNHVELDSTRRIDISNRIRIIIVEGEGNKWMTLI